MKLSEHAFIRSISPERRDTILAEIEILSPREGAIIFEEKYGTANSTTSDPNRANIPNVSSVHYWHAYLTRIDGLCLSAGLISGTLGIVYSFGILEKSCTTDI